MLTTQQDKIKTAFERNAKALTLRPSIGQGTAVTKVRLTEGLSCAIEEGPWKLTADMGEKHGGKGAGPNPGVLGRGALGSCLAIGYAMWAAKLGVAFSSLEVEVQADYDSRAEYGVDAVTPGYREVRCIVTVESDEPESEILRLLEEAEAHSSYFHVFSRPQTVRREVRLRTPGR